MSYTETEIARIAHETNRAVQDRNGDELPAQPWPWEPRALLFTTAEAVRQVIAGATPEQVYEQWRAVKTGQGWTVGEKDPDRRTHPCLVPWDDLPDRERVKAELFCAVVHVLAGRNEEETR